MKILFAGFWIGEFGWELMTWIPHLRAISKEYDKTIIGCQSGHEFLYEFADKFYNFDCGRNQSNQWMNSEYKRPAEEYARQIIKGTDIVWYDPQKVYSYSVKSHKNWLTGLQPQEFKSYKQPVEKTIDICVNIRNRDDWDSGFRNWDLSHSNEFCGLLKDKSIACIGRADQSLCGEGMTDYRGVSAEVTANIISSSKVFVSSINGAQHFATLCETPQVVWVTKPDHAERIEKTWNPFDVETKVFLSPDGYWKNRVQWHPEVEQLAEAVRTFL